MRSSSTVILHILFRYYYASCEPRELEKERDDVNSPQQFAYVEFLQKINVRG